MPGRPINNEEHKRDKLLKRIAALEALSPVPGEIRAFALPDAPAGWLEADGAQFLITEFPALASAMYCGDGVNATADWGYKVTEGGTRSTSGTHMVLPDYRGEFLRGWDNGRGKDSGRSLYAAQTDALKTHTHTGVANTAGSHNHSATALSAGEHSHTTTIASGATADNTEVGGSSTRVFNVTNTASTSGASGSHTHTIIVDAWGNHTHTLTIDATGGVETRPTNLAALICIKT